MPVLSTEKDLESLTMTLTAEFAAPADRVWQLWEDPRQLERWWGPPTWPATFEQHDMTPGGRSAYYMTGPDGEKAHGWWQTVAVEAPRRYEYEDGFANEDGSQDDSMGSTTGTVTFDDIPTGTRMTITTRFESAEQLQKMLDMGMEEGLSLAVGQIDELLVGEMA